jgi:hypothetical protein
MNTLRLTLIPGLIAGIISVFTSWFWIGFVFHNYQRRTPETWRKETAAHHFLSSVITLAAALVIATLYVMVARGHAGTLGLGLYGAVWFAVIAWVGFAVPVLLNHVLYVNVHPLFVVGLLLNWLTIALVASCFTSWLLGTPV